MVGGTEAPIAADASESHTEYPGRKRGTAAPRLRLDGYRRPMPRWLPPFLGGSLAIAGLWIALGAQRLLAGRRSWAGRLTRELRRWDGYVRDELSR